MMILWTSLCTSLRLSTPLQAPARLTTGPGRRNSALVSPLLVASLLLGLPAADAWAGETAWRLYEPGHQTPARGFAAAPYALPCGSYGVFELEFDVARTGGDSGQTPESVLAQGQEQPLDYPLLTAEAPAGVFTGKRSSSWNFRQHRHSRHPAPPPCDDGACFTAPDDRPWVAVVDWDGWHGWSVAWTILQASSGDVDVALFPLDDPSLTADFGPRVTDVHLLTQLCRLAEAVEDPAVSPPVLVNLSFGRPAGRETDWGDDEEEEWEEETDDGCDASTLACQIGRVIDHLVERSAELAPERANPTLFVAAAGNHRRLLFPAAHPRVTAVGALDLQQFHQRGRATSSWETPEAVDALFPGYGLCLEYEVGWRQGAAWPAPPGSSYATALMAGWLAPSLEIQRVPDNRGSWAPARSCRGRRCSLIATRGGRAYGKTSWSVEKLVVGTAADQQTACSEATSGGDEITLSRPLGAPRSVAVLPPLSFAEVSPTLLRPTPEPDPCVPCEERLNRGRHRGRGQGSAGQGTVTLPGSGGTGGTAAAFTVGASHKDTTTTLTVQLWAGPAVHPDLVLADLYLRVENALFPVELSSRDRRRLASGEIDLLEMDLSARELPKRFQPSLVWVLRGPSAARGEVEFWTSTPILLRGN